MKKAIIPILIWIGLMGLAACTQLGDRLKEAECLARDNTSNPCN